MEKNILIRTRETKPQSEAASAVERKENILGCFAVRGTPPKKIIVIDDVVTTCATLREAVLTLRAAGAKQIIALAVARA